MQLVIEISDGLYNNLDTIKNGSIASKIILDCVRNGTPLPKGHGKLSDVDWVLNKMSTSDAQPITPNEHYAWDFAKALLRKAPTIIEADKEGEE